MRKIVVLLTVVFLSSCSGFLEENVRGIISPNNFYNSDQEAIQAANGIYLGMRANNLYGGWQGLTAFTIFGSDEAMPSRIFGGLGAIMDYNLTETNYGNAYTIWRDLYGVIGDANSVIANVDGNEKLTVPVQDKVIGEALFLRAMAYYHLTALWGDVPFFTEDLPLDEVAALGRASKEEIRTAMIADLKRAEVLLPSVNEGSDLGRATKWAAKFLRTRFHLWEQDWASALASSKDIIDNSPHALMSTYGEVFDVNNQFNQEAIFGFDFTKDVPSNAQDITDSFNPRLRDEPKNANLRNEFAGKLNDLGEEFNGYGLTVPLTDLVESYPTEDPRRPYNLMDQYLGYDLTFTYFTKRTNFDFVNSPRYNHGEWWITMRLAQVYLMAAEAANELGNTDEALTYTNEIRRRAYGTDSPVAAADQSGIRTAIQDELKWELAGESERRYDLVRWGILVETVRNSSYGIFKGPENIKDYMVKLPIPQEEIDLNPNLLESDASNNGYR
ncbi:RagB/SusD family nutrient uptake outer membrane protein [Arcticibacterium luteifluviistationis]|uniref:RagB/SusD family nutrient uptake outer membrane protein n=1 Tax=Arcticibacterium luteifluviistationis TaxID=1784714 RepID=A0A2Z4GFW6_9BACT|nr:RagB/SusD family nutrient uptake outer membrane protein [Arcticibacterium luteifluviistationis]AWW00141.1 RagB/SusD family nutrient uptake outer membrane protein [Arcticibacterium luteifluviistationis]